MTRFFFLFIVFTLAVCHLGYAQVKEPTVDPSIEQQLENITENSEDVETEDDGYLQELSQYRKNNLNLNTATADQLTALRFVNSLQIESLLKYRNSLGLLINIYELQAIPGWDMETIQKIRPFVTVAMPSKFGNTIGNRLRNGDQYFQLRTTQILEKSRGYLLDSSQAKNFYPGSPQRLFIRYRYNYKNQLQYGFAAEKDAGEEFFKGSQKSGFDYYSGHFFVRDIGIIKSLAIGDYNVNMGQGLTQWMSLAFKKSVAVTSIKRQASVLRPYSSAGEINFHRGAGITIGKRNWEVTAFGSYRKIDGNLNVDTSFFQDDFISSLQVSGLHRTKSEVEDKGAQTQTAFGGNASVQLGKLHLGMNAIHYNFSRPISKDPTPANLYAISGKTFGNYSTDYSYSYRNLHFFGEAAISQTKYTAFINGLLVSVAQNVDMSFLYRNISKGYQALYATAFTESAFPTNENGFYTGIAIKANEKWKVDAYADIYKFPWLRARSNAPTYGKDFVTQVTYKPNRVLEIYTRYKNESKPINYNPDDVTLQPAINQPRQGWRTQLSFSATKSFTFRSRIELVWYDKRDRAAEDGMLIYTDFIYKPMFGKLSGNLRLQYFETDGYNSRLYAYESDVLYGFSIPVFSGKGYRYYVNLNYDLTEKLSIWLRFSKFIYKDQEVVGSGLDAIQGNKRSEMKFQAIYRF